MHNTWEDGGSPRRRGREWRIRRKITFFVKLSLSFTTEAAVLFGRQNSVVMRIHAEDHSTPDM